jgi:hypothetical protein
MGLAVEPSGSIADRKIDRMARVAVLGTGMAAFGAALPAAAGIPRCGPLRQNTSYGGHTASFRHAEGPAPRRPAVRVRQHHLRRDRGAVHGYLDAVGIAYCGRYGEWSYLWTDESFKSGEMAAGRALAALR